MALLVFAILNVMCCYFCYFVGTQKGYNGPLCAFAGLFGSFLACLILLLMPDKASDTFNSAAYNREVSELRQQVKDLQKRITELEHGAAPADQPKKQRRPFKMVPAAFLRSLTSSVWNTAAQKVKNCKARIIPPSRSLRGSGAYQYRSPPTKATLLREPYDLTQIVRNESVRFQDSALCAKCLCAALAAGQRGCNSIWKQIYSTVTLFARFRGLSISQPRWRAT